MQNKYIGGGAGIFSYNAGGGWGPVAHETDEIYDNVGEFLGTGFMQKYDVSLSGGNEKFFLNVLIQPTAGVSSDDSGGDCGWRYFIF